MGLRGITTGMLRMRYQDWLLAENDHPDRRLSDDLIADAMNREHPTGKRIPAEDIRGIRGHYNAGRQGHGPPRDGRLSYPYDERGRQYRYPRTGWRRDDRERG